MSLRREVLPILCYAMLAGLLALTVAVFTRGTATSFIDPDESAHYVNALFLGDWLRAGCPAPLGFARDFYAHFPRLTIGHWPPGWYALSAPVFALTRPSPHAALLLSAFLSGLPAMLIVAAGRRVLPLWIAVLAALGYLLLPLPVEAARAFLLDQPVTLVVGLAALAWVRAAERPSWTRMLIFALLAAAAPLVKGNGALVALIPPIDLALTRRWDLLRRSSLWGAAALAMVLVTPWYLISFRISAGGFNYAPGPAYAWAALVANVRTMLDNVGPGGLALAALGLVFAWRARAIAPERTRIAALAAAVILATLVFQSAVPASLEPRYVAPLLPWLALLAALGAAELIATDGARAKGGAILLALVTIAPAIVRLATLPPKPDIGAPALGEAMRARGGIWLVDGRSGGEGALIASGAWADGGARKLWVARASQWLSTSDFMGRGYRLTARTPEDARAVLDRLGVAGVVSVAEHDRPAYPHSRVLAAALADPADPAYRTERRAFVRGGGMLLVAVRRQAVAPHPRLLDTGSGSTNLRKMSATLG